MAYINYPREFTEYNNFSIAFERLKRGSNRLYKGFSRHLFASYDLSKKENLEILTEEVKNGTYQPSRAETVFYPKYTGVLRPVRILSIKDQIVYQSIANVIANRFREEQKKFKFNKTFGAIFAGKISPYFYEDWKICYGLYNKAILEAYEEGNKYVGEFDLVSFYDLIDHCLLEDCLRLSVDSEDLIELLCRCLKEWTAIRQNTYFEHGVPQGPEASAFIAECVLFNIDRQEFKDVKYFRYIDDIRLIGKSEPILRRALIKLDIASKTLGLVPQAQKIKIKEIKERKELEAHTVPSDLAVIPTPYRDVVTTKQHNELEKLFRGSLKKINNEWVIENPTDFKFSLLRMRPRKNVLNRIRPLAVKYYYLSSVFAEYLKMFPENVIAADIVLEALKNDPVYDACAANYIDALDVCEPPGENREYRRVINRVKGSSEERSILLDIAVLTFRGRRLGPRDAVELVKGVKNPLVKSILIGRLFHSYSGTAFTLEHCFDLLETLLKSDDDDLSRFAALLLLDYPNYKYSKKRWQNVNDSVVLLMKALGLRRRGPKRLRVLEKFFQDKLHIYTTISWRKALGEDWQEVEKKCLRLQNYERVDPTAYVAYLDTFNEILIQKFSQKHPALKKVYKKAAGRKIHPDLGLWLRDPSLGLVLPKGINWFLRVHDTRVKSDIAHAKTRKGLPTKPVPRKEADDIMGKSIQPLAELIGEWRKVL